MRTHLFRLNRSPFFPARVFAFFALAFFAPLALRAEPQTLKVQFLPPPMEGTLSVGVYDAAGKLVRVLYQEAELSAFTAEDNGLIAEWDGKDDSGKMAPAGTYRIRGVTVGNVQVEGESFLGNGWVTNEDAPHIKRITKLTGQAGEAKIKMEALLPGPQSGAPVKASYWVEVRRHDALNALDLVLIESPDSPAQTETTNSAQAAARTFIVASKVLLSRPRLSSGIGLNPDIAPQNPLPFPKKGKDFLHDLGLEQSANPPLRQTLPVPDGVFHFYENDRRQSLLYYSLKLGYPMIVFEIDILASDTYESVASLLKFPNGKPFVPAPALKAALIPNALKDDGKPGAISLRALVTGEGSFLAVADGLPLCKVSDTPHLRWAQIGRAGAKEPLSFFQSDGAVVESFKITGVHQMMTFEAGTVKLNPQKPALEDLPPPPPEDPAPLPSPTPAATPASTGLTG